MISFDERLVPLLDGQLAEVVGDNPPACALVLGSGFASLADLVDDPYRFAYSGIGHYPQRIPAVPGHTGELLIGAIEGLRVAIFVGRVHMYQGIDAAGAAFTARTAAAIGARTLIVTNAAGGVSVRVRRGQVMLISDHINLTGDNPLVGWAGPPGGSPFVPMSDPYDPGLRELAREVARQEEVNLAEGVYAGVLGPSFETAAEVAYLRSIGADAVGMSTVPEVIVARASGLRVMGLSLITNVAAGHDTSHEEVLEAGRDASEQLTRLLLAILRKL